MSAERVAEVSLVWNGATRVDVRQLRAGASLFAGGAAGTLPVAHGIASGDRFELVHHGVDGVDVGVPRGVRLWDLHRSAELTGGEVVESPVPGRRHRVGDGERVRLEFGKVAVDVAGRAAAVRAARPWWERIDGDFAANVTIALLMLVTFQRAVAITDFETWLPADDLSVAYRTIGYVPPVVMKPKEPVFTPIAKVARPEVTETAAVAKPSKQATRDDKRRALRDVGLIGALQKLGKSASAVFGPGGPASDALARLGNTGPGPGAMASAGLDGVGSRTGPGGSPNGTPLSIGNLGRPGRRGIGCDGCSLAIGGGGKPETKFEPGKVVVRDGIDKEAVRRIIRRHMSEITSCYERALQQDPNVSGKVAMRFVIGPTGEVTETGATENTTSNADLEACMNGRIRTWMFPAPNGGGIAEVNYPFVLQVAH